MAILRFEAFIKRCCARQRRLAVAVASICLIVCGAASKPPAQPLGVVRLPPAQQHAMRAAIDAQLASGDGRLCIPGPDAFPAIVESDDADTDLHSNVARLVAIGFVRVLDTRTGSDGVTATSYDLTNAGGRLFATYRRWGFSGEEHGWCFAQFRVSRIVAVDASPACPPVLRPNPGGLHAHADDPCTASVTYTPQVYDVAAWAAEPQAQAFPAIATLSVFAQTDQTMTLELIGESAAGAWRALPGQFSSPDTP